MLQLIDFCDRNRSRQEIEMALPRADFDIDKAVRAVLPIMEDVHKRGMAAVVEATKRFDHVDSDHIRVSHEEIASSLGLVDDDVKNAIKESIKHNTLGHTQQLPRESTVTIVPGGKVKQRWIPVERVGLYVPGGLTVYPSSVIMNVVAAQVAGVKSIAIVSPPQKNYNNSVHPLILAACHLLGVTEVYAVGGAQAIAMLAYGVQESIGCRPVDVITGPGNIYVAAAKRIARHTCGIDAEAGTTEIAIIADESARCDFVAADLLSQAEHDPCAASVLITTSKTLAKQVDIQLEHQARQTKHRERVYQALTSHQSGIVLVDTIEQAIRVANIYAAEHLEIMTRDPHRVAEQIHNAGAIFTGSYTPVPVGDYIAGSNHVLPTGGTARYNGGLSVMAYLKPVQQVEYDAHALRQVEKPLKALALGEDLPAHYHAVHIRTSS